MSKGDGVQQGITGRMLENLETHFALLVDADERHGRLYGG
jgi:hypothetical protein